MRYNCDWDTVAGQIRNSYLTVAKGIAACLPGSHADIDPPSDSDPVALISTRRAKFYLSFDEDNSELSMWVEPRD
jgi:hypothetical protein